MIKKNKKKTTFFLVNEPMSKMNDFSLIRQNSLSKCEKCIYQMQYFSEVLKIFLYIILCCNEPFD